MQRFERHTPDLVVTVLAALAALALSSPSVAQPPAGFGPPRQAQPDNLPAAPTAVALPSMSAEITGPGAMFDSAPSQAPGLGPDHFGYATKEYFVSGTADGRPYTTRVVVRMPADAGAFSGLVLAESMHSSGSAHAFEYTAVYVMDSGHAAVEI
ncbi:MAG TPA: alpha/beta hydrolase domain-containing protein, partial [Gammaproteobacteria bacterium]